MSGHRDGYSKVLRNDEEVDEAKDDYSLGLHLAHQGGSRSPVVDRVPGGGILFFTRFSKNESTTMVVNKGVGVQIFGYSLKSRYYSVVNLGVGALMGDAFSDRGTSSFFRVF